MTTTKWRSLLKYLRTAFPVGCQVEVRRCNRKECAVTIFDGRTYRIRINASQDTRGQQDSILHEWAHVCAIEQAYRHEGPWGQIFASIYESWSKEFFNGE
jgi:hypothetical protein